MAASRLVVTRRGLWLRSGGAEVADRRARLAVAGGQRDVEVGVPCAEPQQFGAEVADRRAAA